MKTTTISFFIITTLIIAACSSSKKVTSSASDTSEKKSSNGIYAPGQEELVALQAQYPNVTIDLLTQGHKLYSQGACIKCHGAKNIYRFETPQWKGIIDKMAVKAKISDFEKDAVYKYVLAIKATQKK